MDLGSFPPHVLINIFSNLNLRDIVCRVRQTCWAWHNLSYQKIFWSNLNTLKFRDSSFTKLSYLELVASVSDLVETLSIDLNSIELGEVLFAKDCCPNVQRMEITLPNKAVNDSAHKNSINKLRKCFLKISAEEKHHIHSLSFTSCTGCSYILEQLVTEQSVPVFPNLTEIKIDFSEHVPVGFLVAHRHLKHITFNNTSIDSESLKELLYGFPALETLDLKGSFLSVDMSHCHIEGESENLGAASFHPCLRKLILDESPCNDSLFRLFVKGAFNLEYISVCMCRNLTNIGIEFLGLHCPKLKTLILNSGQFSTCNVTNSALEHIAKQCKQLHTLQANFCTELSDQSLQTVAMNCTGLTHLDFGGCTALTDAAVMSLIDHCPYLRHLDLRNCVQLTAASVNPVLCKLVHLQYFNLVSCHRLSNLALSQKRQAADVNDSQTNAKYGNSEDSCNGALAGETTHSKAKKVVNKLVTLKHHSHLRKLYLQYCSKLSNRCLKEIATWCPDLRKLDIQACAMVSNGGLIDIVRACRHLKYLNASGGSIIGKSQLDDYFLEAVAEHCEKLEMLILTAIYNISVDGIAMVIRQCPMINYVKVSESVGPQTKGVSVNCRTLQSVASTIDTKILRLVQTGSVIDIFVCSNVEKKQLLHMEEKKQ